MSTDEHVQVGDGWAESNGQDLIDFLYDLKDIAFSIVNSKWINPLGQELPATALMVFQAVTVMIESKLKQIERDNQASTRHSLTGSTTSTAGGKPPTRAAALWTVG